MKRLTGKNIVVTGASRGIGAGIARCVALQGARVAVTYTSRPEAAQGVIKDLAGEGHLCLQMDISNESSVRETMDKILEAWGTIDALINNAGITQDQLILRMKTEDFERVINTNLKGTFLCTRAVLRAMLKARKGSIVNITSVIGQTGNAGQSNYAASKAGVEAFSKSVAQEVGSRNIRVNCVAPGFIVTEMTAALSEAQKEEILKKVPLSRLGQADDVAQAVTFLVSDESSYVTGQTISVNGGLFM